MSIVKKWEKDVSKLLLNRTIVKVRYMSDEEVDVCQHEEYTVLSYGR